MSRVGVVCITHPIYHPAITLKRTGRYYRRWIVRMNTCQLARTAWRCVRAIVSWLIFSVKWGLSFFVTRLLTIDGALTL